MTYYGLKLDELSLAQAAMIASLPKAPSRINPITNLERATIRRNYVLNRMLELGFISSQEFQQAYSEPDRAYPHGFITEVDAPYVGEMIRSEAVEKFGQKAYTDGYQIYTTINSNLQKAANNALVDALHDYDQRHGYRGAEQYYDLNDALTPSDWDKLLQNYFPINGLHPGLVIDSSPETALVYLADGQTVALDITSIRWAKRHINNNTIGSAPQTVDEVLQVGDIIRVTRRAESSWQLAQIPDVQGALVALNPNNGDIQALTGGFSFRLNKFNRATQGKRQPGSSFKPFIYSAALEKNFTPATLVNDAPVVFDDPALERDWRPENYSGKFYGPTRLREGIVNSRNLVSIRVLRNIGINYARNYITRFGFDINDLPQNLTLALGSASLSPLSIARGYATFANGGYLIEPQIIDHIINNKGTIIYQTEPKIACSECEHHNNNDNPFHNLATRAISPQNQYVMDSLLRDVIQRGTGKKARSLNRRDLAGKTGTTNDQRDAWFSGYNHSIVTTAWVGFDQLTPLGRGEVGGRAALPMWIDFMRVALEGVPEKTQTLPTGLVTVKIDPDTGKLASNNSKKTILEIFREDQVPPLNESSANNENNHDNPHDIF